MSTMSKFATLATMTLGFTCLAQPGGGRLNSHLSLTDSQMQNLRTIREQHRQATQASMEDLHTKERALRDQLNAGSTDAATLGRMLIEIESARKRNETSRQAFREQAVAALSADQRARLKTLEEARKLVPAIHEAEMMGFLDGPGGDGVAMGDRPGPPPFGAGRSGGPQPRGGRFGGGEPRFRQ